MEFLVGLLFGVLLGIITSIHSADKLIQAYAEKQKLYRVGDKMYEIKEVGR